MLRHLPLASALLLGACATGEVGRADRAADPPEGSIQVSEHVWMVPVGQDVTGCTQYTAWSLEGAVLTVIQYQRQDGSFSALRDEADCPPPD